MSRINKELNKTEVALEEKIEYLGLNFERVPKNLIAPKDLKFKPVKGYDERVYKQYRYIDVNDIDIFLSPTHRTDSLQERYEEAMPLYMYLDSQSEENEERYNTFLKLLKKVDIEEIEKVEEEQKELNKKIPYKVKFNGNYLWQIYYSEYKDKYFMLLPTEDSDYSTFFYLLRKKAKKSNDKIFVPISYLEYSGAILKPSELKDLENYLWTFTNDYPSIYEVYDKEGKPTLQIIGSTKIYGRIKSLYKMEYDSRKEASKFLKLLKALFIFQVELPHYFKFTTGINETGNLTLCFEGEEVVYNKLIDFVYDQYKKSVYIKNEINGNIDDLKRNLEELRQESKKLEKEYIEKEKMITTFLECKKSFFGKVKFYFSAGKKSKKVKEKVDKEENKEEQENSTIKQELSVEKRSYTLDELIESFRELELIENNQKSVIQDINAMKLKNKNLKKKIENASSYINEINKHKKSIFEFWKYSNKDEVAALEEGEEVDSATTKIEKTFNFDEDFLEFGEKVDKNQRMKFTDSELDGCYIASTDLLELMNKSYDKDSIDIDEFAKKLKEIKEEKASRSEEDSEEFDVFGNLYDNGTKKSLGDKLHRETKRDKIQILGIRDEMTNAKFKKVLFDAMKNVKKAFKKNILEENIYVYRACEEEEIFKGIQKFSLDEEKELEKYLYENNGNKKINLYRIKVDKGINFVGLTNIIFYNNRNMTLPLGMQEESDILLDLNEVEIDEFDRKDVKISYLEDRKDDFSKILFKNINICEFEVFKH